MRLEDAPYYKPLCWFIKKYCGVHLPNPDTDARSDADSTAGITVWGCTPDGHNYWMMIMSKEHVLIKKEEDEEYTYFELMEKYYKLEFNPQLELFEE
jgi:hypothetical protein